MDGDSQRSRSGQMMFTEPESKTPFSKLRFDVDSLVSPLGGGGGAARPEDDGLRLGMPGDHQLDDAIRLSPAVPAGFAERLHRLVDELAEDAAV